MINKELDNIMSEYVDKASTFCQDYEKAVLGRKHNTFSSELEKIYSNLESELWRLKHNTEELLYMANDKFICGESIRQKHTITAINLDLAGKEIEEVQRDLNTMHDYYLHRYAANIARGLAEQWSKEANEAAFDIMKSAVKSMVKGGAENDN